MWWTQIDSSSCDLWNCILIRVWCQNAFNIFMFGQGLLIREWKSIVSECDWVYFTACWRKLKQALQKCSYPFSLRIHTSRIFICSYTKTSYLALQEPWDERFNTCSEFGEPKKLEYGRQGNLCAQEALAVSITTAHMLNITWRGLEL